jgi:hypothetical protein
MNGFRLSFGVIALAVALLALTMVVLDQWYTCRRFFFCGARLVRWADGVNLMQNPSFEDPPDLNPGKDHLALPLGDTRLTPWTVVGTTGQNVALGQNGNNYEIATPYQTRFLDLTGDSDAPNPKTGFFAGVQQTIPTVPGEPYQLTFQIGLMTAATIGGPVQAVANLGDGTGSGQPPYTFTCGPYNPTTRGSEWKPCGPYTFVAKTVSTTLAISGVQVAGQSTKYIGLDLVDLECVAPLGDHNRCR